MSTSMLSQPKHVELVDRLFARFLALFGAQKMSVMWADADMSEVKAVWADQLSRFQPATIGNALQNLIASGREWPPALPEFIEMCRESAVSMQSHAPAIAHSLPVTERDVARENLDRIRSMLSRVGETGRRDPLHWAKHPKSLQAVKLLVRGAQHDPRLRDILRGHVEDAGDRLPNDESIRYFTAVLERDHSLLTAESETPTR